MMQLLLVSTSTTHGTGYLDHCAAAAAELFAGRDRILFVPYALFDRDGYAAKVRERFAALGLEVDSIHRADDPCQAVAEAQGIFIGGGNTFRLLKSLRDAGLIDPIRERVTAGMPYMGTSAGSNMACPTIKTTNDMPILFPGSFDALALIPFQLNPHYLDPDPGSTHMGETRETRIREYLEENDGPVLGLREGAMLRRRGEQLLLQGERGARLFRRGADPAEHEPGADLAFLLGGP